MKWLQKYGIDPGQLPKPTKSGKAILAGSGHTVWQDMAVYGSPDCDVMCINDIGMHWPWPFEHWYSNDWRMLPRWVEARRPRYRMEHDENIQTHCCNPEIETYWPWPGHGTSSLNGVFTLLAMGYSPIVIVGVPLDDKGHYFDPPYPTSPHARTNFHREGTLKPWRQFAPYVKGEVFSMSGNSREILGAPSSYSPSVDQALAL